MDTEVKVVEVGPRDGLQNEKQSLSTDDKVKFIHYLAESGLKHIEVTSFVSPKAVPQMSDSENLFKRVKDLGKQVNLLALVPNQSGMEKALLLGLKEVAIFTATSESFNQKNIKASIDESFERIEKVVAIAKANKIRVRAYISTVFGCPYEGDKSYKELKPVLERILSLGPYEFALGDTIGVATPNHVVDLLKNVKKDFGLEKCAVHFHDTRGMAVANSLVSLNEGIRIFDSSAGGLGGCPYAKGATGNVATEDLVYLLESMGMQTGVNLEKVAKASSFILDKLGKESSSKYHQVLKKGPS